LIDSQHFGTCDSHTDFKVKGQKSKSRAGAYCGGHLAAQLVYCAPSIAVKAGSLHCGHVIDGGDGSELH